MTNPDLERLLTIASHEGSNWKAWEDDQPEFIQLKGKIEKSESIIEFLNEVEEQDWELDSDDIKHILKLDFDYIRKQYES